MRNERLLSCEMEAYLGWCKEALVPPFTCMHSMTTLDVFTLHCYRLNLNHSMANVVRKSSTCLEAFAESILIPSTSTF
jgi:hypothetical protein